jgi:hypothetical protein
VLLLALEVFLQIEMSAEEQLVVLPVLVVAAMVVAEAAVLEVL